MKKIFTEILCPVLSGKYDFILDGRMTAGEAAESIAEEIRKFTGADFLFRGRKLLYSAVSGLPLEPSVQLCEYGITSGMRLMITEEREDGR